jgi:hypothetical protein
MNIPEAVLKEAKELLALEDGKIELLGKEDNFTYYIFRPDKENIVTGYPSVFIYNGTSAMEVSGEEALDIIDRLVVE